MTTTFGELARATGGELLSGDASAPAGGFFVDSRKLKAGDVFVAVPGERVDGHEFVADVLARGAGGALVSRRPAGPASPRPVLLVKDTVEALQAAARHRRSSSSARVVGVTGSNGKTTTKEMIAQVLAAGGKSVYSTPGNFNSRIGLPIALWSLELRHTHAVFEMGASAKGHIAALAALARPHVGVLTHIGRAHIETFGSREGVAEAKWELVASLPPEGLAVLNADDPFLMARRPRARARVVTYGLTPGAEVRAEDVAQDPAASFTLVAGGKKVPVRLPVPGTFNVSNALAAAAVALNEGLSLEDIVRGLAGFRAPAQRMQERRGKGGSLFLVDAYNANPDSMKASLESFAAAYPRLRRVAVLGGMRELGDTSAAEHRALGALAAGAGLDKLFFLGPEGAEVAAGWTGSKAGLTLAADKPALRSLLEKELLPNTVFLFKASRGVGMEDVYELLLEEAR
jgi:UDP-N-acetylmuramoyl-tripeptide--D-alanyl-D-alanine ligase